MVLPPRSNGGLVKSNDRRWEMVPPSRIRSNESFIWQMNNRKAFCAAAGKARSQEPRCKDDEAQSRNIEPYQQTIQLSGVPQKHWFQSSWWGPITQVITIHTTVQARLWGYWLRSSHATHRKLGSGKVRWSLLATVPVPKVRMRERKSLVWGLADSVFPTLHK